MADPKPKTEQEVGPDKRRSMDALFDEGFNRGTGELGESYFEGLARNSALNFDGYEGVFKNKDIPLESKAAYVAGRVAHDVLTDGTRTPYWALNHPLAITGVIGHEASTPAGLAPNSKEIIADLEKRGDRVTRTAIDEEFARREGFRFNGQGEGPPLTLAKHAIPAMATAAMTMASDNTNYLNLLGGGRTPGFQAVLPVEGDPTQSSNPLLELGARYLFGRTGRVLPWEEFTAERPDVSYDDYQSYVAYQFDKGPLGIGLIRGTSRNLDGEPEAAMMGFRVPFSAATSAAGAMAGGYLGATQAEHFINAEMQDRLKLGTGGARRLAGAAIGGVLGAIGGKISGNLVNDLVIQPAFNPERVAAAKAWQSLTPEQKIAIAEGKGSNKHDQGTQLALLQA
jgi:hypothetical protein